MNIIMLTKKKAPRTHYKVIPFDIRERISATLKRKYRDNWEPTERDIAVMRLLSKGNSNKIIADAMNVSEQNIKNRVSRLIRITHSNNRIGLVVYYIRKVERKYGLQL